MKTIRFIILLALAILSQQIVAQSVTVSGFIIDMNTKQPISNAEIEVLNSNQSTISNSNGSFSVKNINQASNILVIHHVSYMDKRVKLNSDTISILVELKPSILNLDEVEIHALFDKQLPFSVSKIDLRKIEETNISDIGEIIAQEPNIGAIRKGATGLDPVVRGFKYSQVGVQINGNTRIEGGCPNRMDPTASHVNINDINNISIYKGPFALKYGVNFGGIINLSTNKPLFYNKFENHVSIILGGQTNHSGYKTGIRINGGNKSISYLVSVNRNKYGDYTSGNGIIIPSSSYNYNVSMAMGFVPLDGHFINISMDRSWGRNVDFAALPMDERMDDTKVGEFSYQITRLIKPINLIKINAYFSDVNHEMDNKNRPFSDTVVAISKIHAKNTGGRIAANINLMDGLLDVGGNYEHINKYGDRDKWLMMQHDLPSFSENIWNNATIDNMGIFAEYQKTYKRIDWIISARLDFNYANSDPMYRNKPSGNPVYYNDNTKSNFTNFSFSSGISWNINDVNKLSIAIGKGTRSPDMTERFIMLLPVGYDNYDYLGNPDLLPETNHEIDFGYNFINDRFGTLTTSIFFSYVTNYISAVRVPPSEVMPQTKGVLGVKMFTNIPEAYLTGFEINYSTSGKTKWQFVFNSAYTIGKNPETTVYTIEDGSVVDESTVKNDPLPEIPPLEANIWFKYKFYNNKLIPEIHVRLVASQNQISKAYSEEITPGFSLLNLKINYVYSTTLHVNFGVNNILDTEYYEHLNRRIIGTKDPFLEPGRVFYTNLIIKF